MGKVLIIHSTRGLTSCFSYMRDLPRPEQALSSSPLTAELQDILGPVE